MHLVDGRHDRGDAENLKRLKRNPGRVRLTMNPDNTRFNPRFIIIYDIYDGYPVG